MQTYPVQTVMAIEAIEEAIKSLTDANNQRIAHITECCPVSMPMIDLPSAQKRCQACHERMAVAESVDRLIGELDRALARHDEALWDLFKE